MPGKSWYFLPPDQLTLSAGPLARANPTDTGVILIESRWWARRRPHHKQKIALVFASLRHFAIALGEADFEVRYESTDAPFEATLRRVIKELRSPVRMMRPASRELRKDLEPLIESGDIEIVANEMWLTSPEDFFASQEGPPWRMDRFYRHVRKSTGILMEDATPVGGKYSFDSENRESWDGTPPAPAPPVFPRDPIKQDVCAMVEREFGDHPGRVDLDHLPATASDADAAWQWALHKALPHFGPYEDAMSTKSATLFHTMISPLMNLGRILPADSLDDVLHARVPLQCVEGFVRQVIGWREFVRHVHEATDGFRDIAGDSPPIIAGHNDEPARLDRGAAPNFLASDKRLPDAYWGAPSGLHCLDVVVADVVASGWSHHITRLMILSNLATLLDYSPRELTDWFWDMYIDAWDWVVEPNVLGMGTFAAGPLMTTKPYVSGAAYINKMGDYCSSCAFDPKTDCPITHLYWQFLDRKSALLFDNPRLRLPLANLDRRSEVKRAYDRVVFEWVRETLAAGEILRPEAVPSDAEMVGP